MRHPEWRARRRRRSCRPPPRRSPPFLRLAYAPACMVDANQVMSSRAADTAHAILTVMRAAQAELAPLVRQAATDAFGADDPTADTVITSYTRRSSTVPGSERECPVVHRQQRWGG